MEKHTQSTPSLSMPMWDALETWARSEIQKRLQQVLEEEVTASQTCADLRHDLGEAPPSARVGSAI